MPNIDLFGSVRTTVQVQPSADAQNAQQPGPPVRGVRRLGEDTRERSKRAFAELEAQAASMGGAIFVPEQPRPESTKRNVIQSAFSRTLSIEPTGTVSGQFEFVTPNPTAVLFRYARSNAIEPGLMSGVYAIEGFSDSGVNGPAVGPYSLENETLNADNGLPIRQVGECLVLYGTRFNFSVAFADVSTAVENAFIVEFLPYNVTAPTPISLIAQPGASVRVPVYSKRYSVQPMNAGPGVAIAVEERSILGATSNDYSYTATDDNMGACDIKTLAPETFFLVNNGARPLMFTFLPNGA